MIRAFVAASIVWFCATAAALAADPYKAVCTVSMPGPGFYGSGTLIAVSNDSALVLSCAHVAREKGQTAILDWKLAGATASGRVLAVNTDDDLALIVCTRPKGVDPVPVRLPSKARGPFVNVGFPSYGRTVPHWQTGGYRSLSTNRFTYSARPFPGMSGGATFDSQGYLVGVVIAYANDHGTSASGTALIEFINQARAERPAGILSDSPGCWRRDSPRTEPYGDDAPKFDFPGDEPESVPEPEVLPTPPEEKGPNVDINVIIALLATVAGAVGAFIAANHDDDPENDIDPSVLVKDIVARIQKARA